MSKLIIMCGLPASGKSTRAKELIANSGNAVRVNKDLLRTMLHFDKFSGVNEGRTREAARAIVKAMLGKVNVIVDDTNLNPGTLQGWKDLAKECGATPVVERMETEMFECIQRDRARQREGKPFVGQSVIVSMALRSGLYPHPQNGFVLCDLDGTLADIRHRLHFVQDLPEGQKKDWKSFFEHIPLDGLREEVAEKVEKFFKDGYDIILLSARPDTYREETEKWLEAFRIPYVGLLMRPGRDTRPDTEVKSDILASHFPDLSLIHKVIDDRPSVIRMWREKGLDVIDVGNGVDF